MTEQTLKRMIETMLVDSMYAVRDAAEGVEEAIIPPEGVEEITSVIDFERAGMLSREQGLLVRTVEGAEFQVTVLRRH